jgi:hypothetical protein
LNLRNFQYVLTVFSNGFLCLLQKEILVISTKQFFRVFSFGIKLNLRFQDFVSDEEGPPPMAPPPLPPDYSGGKVENSATMGWINPAPDTASQQMVSPSVHQASDDWGGWGGGAGGSSTPAVKAAENGADPWDSQAGSSDASASKITGQNAASTNQVIGIFRQN